MVKILKLNFDQDIENHYFEAEICEPCVMTLNKTISDGGITVDFLAVQDSSIGDLVTQ